ncbi:MAG: hypothetical protein EON59_17890, partial [Alphaproteobacteria bacterium]
MGQFNGTRNADVYLGTAGDDVVTNAGVGLDVILTGFGDDTVTVVPEGRGLLDILPDVVNMGPGNDHLIIDYRSATAPVVLEAPLFDSSAGGLLGGITLGGLNAFSFTGADRFTIRTGSGADDVSGGSGSDSFNTGRGDDHIFGGAGIDRINGGAGADTMIGGQGDDYYRVDNAGDRVVENPNEGHDTVQSVVSFSLGGS